MSGTTMKMSPFLEYAAGQERVLILVRVNSSYLLDGH